MDVIIEFTKAANCHVNSKFSCRKIRWNMIPTTFKCFSLNSNDTTWFFKKINSEWETIVLIPWKHCHSKRRWHYLLEIIYTLLITSNYSVLHMFCTNDIEEKQRSENTPSSLSSIFHIPYGILSIAVFELHWLCPYNIHILGKKDLFIIICIQRVSHKNVMYSISNSARFKFQPERYSKWRSKCRPKWRRIL